MKRNLLTGVAVIVTALSACNDETLDIGKTLTPQTDKLELSSADFVVSNSMRTVMVDSVLLRSSYCYLGKVKDPETGAYITSEFTTQFNVLSTFSMPNADTIATRYNGMVAADSCRLEFYMDEAKSITDTLAAMKIRVSELDSPMEEGRKYYSNYDPVALGLLREGGLVKDKMFSYNDLTVSDSVRNKSTYYNFINVKLNDPYTDKNGVTYNNYGTYIMQMYYQHPEYFKNSYAFIHNVCPGIFVSVRDGEGVYTEIPEMCLRLYYQMKTNKKDSTYTRAELFAGTEEVLQTTKISTERDILKELLEDNSCTYLKAPAGLFTEVTLPVDEVYQGHENDSILTAKISFQRINSDFADKALHTPRYMVMVPKDSLHTFFENKKLPDNQTSYSTTLSTSTNLYSFANISDLITILANKKRKGMMADNNWVAKHPDWNKVMLVPVTAVTTTVSGSSSVSAYEHCIGITSTRLVGGANNPYDPVKLNVIYGKFK